MNLWRPKELIIHEDVRDDETAKSIVRRCRGVPVTYVTSGRSKDIVAASPTLSTASGLFDKIQRGKQVLYVAPARAAVDEFKMADRRMVCPHFQRLKCSSNGCYFACEWCYLRLTYRAAHPFITVRVQYDKIWNQITKKLHKTNDGVLYNSGELGDSLSLNRLTRAMEYFIPRFAGSANGYLFSLSKSDNVDDILKLRHNGRTILTWSLNAPEISKRYEIGAPPFKKRLEAARKAQEAGYPVRVRLDPIVNVDGWEKIYARTIGEIFDTIAPQRVTLGTLRFEPGFHRLRKSIFSAGCDLRTYLDRMTPMFRQARGTKKKKVGKYSFSEETRSKIFSFAIEEIRRRSDCPIALCKEARAVWKGVGLDLSRCACVCQLHAVNMMRP